jgi:hypothetical protein
MTNQAIDRTRKGGRWYGAISAVAVVLAFLACDFDVSNPGPVPDVFLDDEDAHRAVVNGTARALADAHSELSRVTGAVTREIFASGNTGIYGINVEEGRGLLEEDLVNGFWSDAHNARWVGEEAVRRLTEVGADANLLAEAHIWAGYSNRFLGENFCEAVIDGGSAEPHTVYFDRAEANFTSALGMATDADLQLAARAGRATVYMSLGQWSAADTDAQMIPESFEFEVLYSTEEQGQYNTIRWSVANAPYRGHSVWNTKYEQYFLDTGDPRTAWSEDPDFPHGPVERQCCGLVPWKFQLKYPGNGDNIDLADGQEMKLIRAEALLVAGSWAEAMVLINDVRTSVTSQTTGLALDPWVATNLTEAWGYLKQERGIELWLEGRRMNDLRRWQANGTPGALDPLEDASNPDTYLDPNQSLCVPIALAEKETNPNVR